MDKARASYRRAMRTGPTAAERRRHVEVLRELRRALESGDNALATNIGNIADEADHYPLRELGGGQCRALASSSRMPFPIRPGDADSKPGLLPRSPQNEYE
jgi:hypothetical protein